MSIFDELRIEPTDDDFDRRLKRNTRSAIIFGLFCAFIVLCLLADVAIKTWA